MQSLHAIKQVLRFVLAREDAALADPPISPWLDAKPAASLAASLARLPPQDLLATIRRQRLETILAADAEACTLLAAIGPRLQERARRETMAALALASLTDSIAALFAQAGLAMLVIKGVPLAMQTTGSLAGRGRGDLDLFVDPEAVVPALALLASQGFAIAFPKDSGYGQASWLGRYCRWTTHQVDLQRRQGPGPEWLDLHWRLNLSIRALPDFATCHGQREWVRIGSSPVATLNRRHAFLHGCGHASGDRWMCLRNLVDLHRLARQLEPDALASLQSIPFVAHTCAVVAEATGGPLGVPFDPRPRRIDRTLLFATAHQLAEWRSQPPRYRLPGPGLRHSLFHLRLINVFGSGWAGWRGALGRLMRLLLPPTSFFHPTTGAPRSPLHFLLGRIRGYGARWHRSTVAARTPARTASRSASRTALRSSTR